MARLLLTVLLALLAPACLVPEEPCTLVIDPSFDAWQRAAIVDAVEQWDAVGADGAACVSVRLHTVRDDDGGPLWGRGGPGWAYIDPDVPAEVFPAVVLHEIGHHVRAHHHAGPGVMVPRIPNDTPACLTAEDVRSAGLSGPGTCP